MKDDVLCTVLGYSVSAFLVLTGTKFIQKNMKCRLAVEDYLP